MATTRLPRPRHGDPVRTTQDLRELAAAVLHEDIETLSRTTAYLRRSYRVVFLGYVAMMVFGIVVGVALLLSGIGFVILSLAVLGGAFRRETAKATAPKFAPTPA